jgi:hypothetical protein
MAGAEHGTAVEGGRPGISRRDALKKGAVAGGAVLWVSPIVQNIGISRAFAQSASPLPHGISFVAFRFTCGGQAYFSKIEFSSAGAGECEGPNASTNCGVNDDGALNGCGLGFYTIDTQFNSSGEPVIVTITLTAACTNAAFVDGQVKCGIGATGGDGCHDGTVVGNVATFICPD